MITKLKVLALSLVLFSLFASEKYGVAQTPVATEINNVNAANNNQNQGNVTLSYIVSDINGNYFSGGYITAEIYYNGQYQGTCVSQPVVRGAASCTFHPNQGTGDYSAVVQYDGSVGYSESPTVTYPIYVFRY